MQSRQAKAAPRSTSARCRSSRWRRCSARRRSIRRPPAGNVEHRAGREGVVRRGAERHERRDLLDLDETAARNFRQHVVDVLLRHLVEDRGFRRGRRDALTAMS